MNWFLFLFLSREREIVHNILSFLCSSFPAFSMKSVNNWCTRVLLCAVHLVHWFVWNLSWMKNQTFFFFRDFTAIYWTMVGAPQLKFTHNFSDVFVQFEIQHCFVGMEMMKLLNYGAVCIKVKTKGYQIWDDDLWTA